MRYNCTTRASTRYSAGKPFDCDVLLILLFKMLSVFWPLSVSMHRLSVLPKVRTGAGCSYSCRLSSAGRAQDATIVLDPYL